ncbi:hypothetical protein VTN77DRAFT_3947 [Rasamsonia byssochlamydoides]|uniref:uncharacterized protein n=1 Tax=Rasamsonia byssochlamydoides TaxID=89139 RepID=UPI003741FB64
MLAIAPYQSLFSGTIVLKCSKQIICSPYLKQPTGLNHLANDVLDTVFLSNFVWEFRSMVMALGTRHLTSRFERRFHVVRLTKNIVQVMGAELTIPPPRWCRSPLLECLLQRVYDEVASILFGKELLVYTRFLGRICRSESSGWLPRGTAGRDLVRIIVCSSCMALQFHCGMAAVEISVILW